MKSSTQIHLIALCKDKDLKWIVKRIPEQFQIIGNNFLVLENILENSSYVENITKNPSITPATNNNGTTTYK